MAQEQNYRVEYEIAVNASEGTKVVEDFATAVERLNKGRQSFAPVVTNINEMMASVEKTFRGKGGKKKDFNFSLDIKTSETETRLTTIRNLLTEIKELTGSIKLVIGPGEKIDGRTLRAQARKVLGKQELDQVQTDLKKSASDAVTTFMGTQRTITKAVGKVNAALAHLEKGREVNIKTDVAKARLQEILSLMYQIKGASKMTLGMGMGSPGLVSGAAPVPLKAPYAQTQAFILPEKEQAKLNQRLYTDQQLHLQKMQQARDKSRLNTDTYGRMAEIRAAERQMRMAEAQRVRADREVARIQAQAQKSRLDDESRRLRSEEALRRKSAAQVLSAAQRQTRAQDAVYGSKRRAAINRLQYSKAPSLRGLPMAGMLNAYMAYSFMRSELMQAVEYSNIMQTAHSILRVADKDLTTFETRFDQMARNVRRIGVETKFTAVEVAGAVKYLSMAGMGIETINESIRPITNLALIGDNDISQLADLITNIAAGYNIKNTSMGSVADILASTVSRSNVNVVEMAESFKMAAGYMRLAGVDFTESAAAIGILGNAGMKSTMAGTSMRAMATRFAKPTKEAQKVLDSLGMKFTRMVDVFGKPVEKLKSLADIFQELHDKGASLADMQAIFGKIGGNAAMMLVTNYEQLRTLASQNKASQGISSELALVKQNTTKGLWAQVTSQLSETFMQGYEIAEPVIRSTLKEFLDKFKSREFAQGLASIGQTLVKILSILGSFAAWITRNYYWIEPILFTGIVGTRLFKLAGALTNVGVALGFIGKQAAATSSMEVISSLVGLGGGRGLGALKGLSMANKRSIISAMQAAGISGKAARSAAMVQGGMTAFAARGAFSSLFSSQVATGSGLVGAAGALSAIGAGAVAAAAGVAALVGALGWVAYKTWQVKKAKDAVQEDINSNEKYHYASIDALYSSLRDTYQQAIATKKAVDDLTSGKTVEDASGQKIGAFTGKWWMAILSAFGSSGMSRYGGYRTPLYTLEDARQDDTRSAITTLARRDSQQRVDAAFADFGKMSDPLAVRAFIENIQMKYGQQELTAAQAADKTNEKKSLWSVGKDGSVSYISSFGDLPETYAALTPDYIRYQNSTTVKDITTAAQGYLAAIENPAGARDIIEKSGFQYDDLTKSGFSQNKDGRWVQKPLGKNATDAERQAQLAGQQKIHFLLVNLISALRLKFGGSAEAAENILQKAGFGPSLYSNEPDSNDNEPFNANRITGVSGADDGGAGGNYSGTGKLSSAAPKQVIVNITNLMSVETIDLMKSPEGQVSEIQNFKGQMAQALIDVVHDFDASWNG